jgi:hypothetical protein
VEGVDRRTVVALESDVGAADGVATADPEVETARVREVGERARLLVDDPVAEPAEHRLVERLRALPVRHVDRDVRDRHPGRWQTASMLFPSGSRTNAA